MKSVDIFQEPRFSTRTEDTGSHDFNECLHSLHVVARRLHLTSPKQKQTLRDHQHQRTEEKPNNTGSARDPINVKKLTGVFYDTALHSAQRIDVIS